MAEHDNSGRRHVGVHDIDADITRARGLSPHAYVSAEVLERERAHVFARSWQLVARADELASVGAFVTTELAGEPVVVVLAEPGDAGLRAYFNVCPHRSGPVARGCGRRKQLVCGYHGWTFALTGELSNAPESEGCDFSGVGLTPISVARWGPLVFAAIEPAMRLGEWFEGIEPPDSSLAFVMRRDYELNANWKVYVDNYLEGYHLPIVHPRLFGELDYENYRTETATWSSRQDAPLRPLPEGSTRTYRAEEGDDAASYHWLFPNLMLNACQGMLQTNVVIPLTEGRTCVRFEWFAPARPPSPDDARFLELVGFSELVQEEDRLICETVQKNLASRGAARGRYVPSRENGVHHFHRLYAAAMR